MSDYYGLPTAVLENSFLRLEYLAGAGPRIVRLAPPGKPNLLAELPDFRVETPNGPFFFRGGHRLWRAPESLAETYRPDNEGQVVEKLADGVRLSWAGGGGITKSIELRLAPDRAALSLLHELHNTTGATVTLAPWALTQFRLGGTAILPQPVGNADPAGLLANRLLVLWPYTRLGDPRLVLRDDCLLIHAAPDAHPVKVGTYNSHGWLAYWLDGTLFRKTFDVRPGASYPDGGCNSESYCNDRFVELESLGPLETLAAGGTARLVETWELYPDLEQDFLPPGVAELVRSLDRKGEGGAPRSSSPRRDGKPGELTEMS